jgi:hypothetical protein
MAVTDWQGQDPFGGHGGHRPVKGDPVCTAMPGARRVTVPSSQIGQRRGGVQLTGAPATRRKGRWPGWRRSAQLDVGRPGPFQHDPGLGGWRQRRDRLRHQPDPALHPPREPAGNRSGPRARRCRSSSAWRRPAATRLRRRSRGEPYHSRQDREGSGKLAAELKKAPTSPAGSNGDAEQPWASRSPRSRAGAGRRVQLRGSPQHG